MCGLRRALLAAMLLLAWCGAAGQPADAAGWAVGLKAGSKGSAQAQGLPAAPTAAATCSLISLSINVSWNAVPHASSYSVYQATASNGPFSLAASGVAGTSWNSGILLLGTYYYRVSATIGSNWAGPQSATTAGHTITVALCT